MAKDYNIQLSDYNDLLSLLKENNDGSDVIKDDIERLEHYIKRTTNNFKYSGEKDNTPIHLDAMDDITCINHSDRIISVIKNNFSYVNPFIFYKPRYSSLSISDHEAVSVAGNFFKDQNDSLYSIFLDIEESLDSHLQFFKPNKDTEGEAFHVASTGDTFIYVPNYSNISKVTILIHELQHAIDALENIDLWSYSTIKEISTVFMELISTEYVADYFKVSKDAYKRKAEIYSIVYKDGLDLLNKTEMLDIIKNEEIANSKQMYSYLYKKGYNRNSVNYNLAHSADSLLLYQLPQYIAMELFYIYKNDKAKAFRILFDIIRYGNDSNIYDILDEYGIELGSSVSKYEEHLSNGLKLKRRY